MDFFSSRLGFFRNCVLSDFFNISFFLGFNRGSLGCMGGCSSCLAAAWAAFLSARGAVLLDLSFSGHFATGAGAVRSRSPRFSPRALGVYGRHPWMRWGVSRARGRQKCALSRPSNPVASWLANSASLDAKHPQLIPGACVSASSPSPLFPSRATWHSFASRDAEFASHDATGFEGREGAHTYRHCARETPHLIHGWRP